MFARIAAPTSSMRGGADLWQSVAAKLVVGSLYYLRDGEVQPAMSRLGTNKRGRFCASSLIRSGRPCAISLRRRA